MLPFLPPWGAVWSRQAELEPLHDKFVALWERRASGMRKPPKLKLDASTLRELRAYAAFCATEDSKLDPASLARHCRYVEDFSPLLDGVRWTRWLHLERGLELASRGGDLLFAAVILRTMVEELSALRQITQLHLQLISLHEGADLAVASKFADLFLARLGQSTSQLDCRNASVHESLLTHYRRLNDYVHPNFGSHNLTIFPERSAAGYVFLDAAVGIYTFFFAMSWASEKLAGTQILYGDAAAHSWSETKQTFLSVSLPRAVARLISTGAPEIGEHFGENMSAWLTGTGDEPLHQDLLRELEPSLSLLAESLLISNSARNTTTRELMDCGLPGLPTTPAEWTIWALCRRAAMTIEDDYPGGPPDFRDDPAGWARFIARILEFAALLTDVKLNTLLISFLRQVNDGNSLVALLAMRSLVEHCGIREYLLVRCHQKWRNTLKRAQNGKLPVSELEALESELGVFLGGTKGTIETDASWGPSWNERHSGAAINLISALNMGLASSPLLREAYDFGSDVLHGRVLSGPELAPPKYLGLQLPLLIKAVNYVDSISAHVLGMHSTEILCALLSDIEHFAGRAESELSNSATILRKMALPPQNALRAGRDYSGDGTMANPFKFPVDRNYHACFYELCRALGITPDTVALVKNANGGWVDKLTTRDKEYFFVVNSPWLPDV